ncbi:MAG: LysE family translocator [Nitrospiraceae bacterium]
MEDLLGFVLAGFALAGSPGPATLSLASTGAAFGARHGLGYMAGIIIGMVIVMGVTASGVAGVLLAVPGATPIVAGMAAAYIVYLAYRIASAPPLADGGGQGRRPAFFGGVFLSLVNPKGYAAMAALFSGFVLVGERFELDAALKVVILVAIMITVDIAWLFLGAALTRFFREPGINRAINVTFAILLVTSVAVTLLL